MHFKKIALATAISSILAGCGADDQAYDTLSKPENSFRKTDVKTDQVYLYMPSMANAPRFAGSMAPFMQGQEKLVTLSFEAGQDNSDSGELKVRMVSPDVISQGEIDKGELGRWIESPDDTSLVLSIPVDYVDYQCKENDYNECTNKEEKVDNNEIRWQDRRFFEPSFEDVAVAEATWNDLVTFAKGCYTKVGSPRVAANPSISWKGYEVTQDGVINFEVKQDYRITNNWSCMFNALEKTNYDMDKLSFTVSQFYSLVPLDLVRSPSDEYEPIVYAKGDEDTFGFFANEVGRPDPSYVGGNFDQKFSYLHRFNPNLEFVDYHLANNFDQNDETRFFKQITKDVIDRINPQLEKVGVPKIRLHEPSGKLSGDLRYNVINLIDEPLDNGLAGYGPSAANPLTGEIVHAHVNQYSGVLRSISDRLWDRIARDYNEKRVEPIKDPNAVETATEASSVSLSSSPEQTQQLTTSTVTSDVGSVVDFDHERMESETLADVMLAVKEELEVAEEALTLEDMSALKELESRLWAENNMYPVSSLREGATLKTLPTSIGGKTFNYQDPSLWNGTIGEVGNLKKWDELTEAQQEEISLFIVGVFYAKTLVHELGHNLGLRHNFKGSNDEPNYFTPDERDEHGLKTVPGYSSIMDYNPSMMNALPVFGPYDLAALRFGYKRQVEATEQVVSTDNGVENQKVYLDAGQYDASLRKDVLDPYKQPSALLSDGTVKALAAEYPAAPMREFDFCTDGNVSLNDNCNRHDEGRSVEEIMEYKLEAYNDNYYTRTIRGMSNDFDEQSIMDYAASRERQFQDWRNFLHNYDRYREIALGFELSHIQMLGLPFIFTDVCQGEPTQWPYPVYCGAPKAVDKARDALVNILITPDHTCEIENTDGSFTYKKLADIISNYSIRNNFPVNYVPTSCFDDTVIASLDEGEKVIGEVGKFLNSGSAPRPAPVNNYSNYIDYIGHWPDKLAAASVLVDRVGMRRSTSRSISSLIELPETTGLDSEGYFTGFPKGDFLLDTLILGTGTLYQNFQDAEGNYRPAEGDFTAITWDDMIEEMPYYDSFPIRHKFALPRFGKTPLNKAILTAMTVTATDQTSDQRDEVFARKITMRSEPVGPSNSLREFKRSNGATYYATPENTYAWYMLGFKADLEALRKAEAANEDLTSVELSVINLADFQDVEKRKALDKQYAYQLQSLENLPVYNRINDLRHDLKVH